MESFRTSKLRFESHSIRRKKIADPVEFKRTMSARPDRAVLSSFATQPGHPSGFDQHEDDIKCSQMARDHDDRPLSNKANIQVDVQVDNSSQSSRKGTRIVAKKLHDLKRESSDIIKSFSQSKMKVDQKVDESVQPAEKAGDEQSVRDKTVFFVQQQ